MSELKHSFKTLMLSYSQIFFSQDAGMAVFLLLATFVNPLVGGCGLISIIIAMAAAKLIGLNSILLNNGTYTFNVLLSGLAIGTLVNPSLTLLILLVIGALLSLFISVWISSFLSRFKLPFLSIPFILTVWMLIIYCKKQGIPIHNNSELNNQSPAMFNQAESFLIDSLPHWLSSYFKTLSIGFFESNLLSGLLISVGLLIYSRIAFGLSMVSFLTAALTIAAFEHAPLFESVHLSGFNYIFVAVSLCGYFLIPSMSSYLLCLALAPLIYFFNLSIIYFLEATQLPHYSFSFSLVVISILSVLNSRQQFKYFLPVQFQLHSPEKNLYAYYIYMERFKKDTFVHIHLPFYGEWKVSQSYNGKQTHQGDYRYAWDFVVVNDNDKTFRSDAKQVNDFYCYALPVLAPADGYVVRLIDGIKDNEIGDVNLNDNWGNSLVLKHNDNLFSQISHLKEKSFKVKLGDYVRRGDVIALCGNSGRSPEPHIHFQIQSSDKIGDKTILYPISYFISKKEKTPQLFSFTSPFENDKIVKPFPNPILKKAFHLIPGMKLNFESLVDSQKKTYQWEVFTNSLNHSYIYCLTSGATAYFTNNDTLFYFTSYVGNKNTLLYDFYLAAYKVLLSHYPQLDIRDNLPVETGNHAILTKLQDFIAPFYIYTKPYYVNSIHQKNEKESTDAYVIKSSIYSNKKNNTKALATYEIELSENGIKQLTITKNNTCYQAKNIA